MRRYGGSFAAHLSSIAWRCVVLVGRDCAVGDAGGWVHGDQGQLCGEQSRADLCEYLCQPGIALLCLYGR
jgi:hypothetical protein